MDEEARQLLQLLSDNIKKQRRQRLVSRELLAEKAGLHYSMVTQIENCVKMPSLMTVKKIGEALYLRDWTSILREVET